MRLAFFAVGIELFFEQLINGFVEGERRTVRTLDLHAHVQPEAARTLHKQLDLAAADFIRSFLSRLIRN